MKIFKVPVGRYYCDGAFLCNLRNTIYGSETASFNSLFTSLQEIRQMLNLAKINDFAKEVGEKTPPNLPGLYVTKN